LCDERRRRRDRRLAGRAGAEEQRGESPRAADATRSHRRILAPAREFLEKSRSSVTLRR
jgi:hypothetical protein